MVSVRSRSISASTAVISPSKIVVPASVASELTSTLRLAPISKRPAARTVRPASLNTSSHVSGRLTSSSMRASSEGGGDGVGQRHAAHVDLEDVRRALSGHQASATASAGAGMSSSVPMRTLNGSSMSLTAAIARHIVGLP